MPSIEMRPLIPVAGTDAHTRSPCPQAELPKSPQNAAPMVSASDVLDPGAPPVDAQRVSEIRKAVESGTYPVIPVRIADAMIAAGFLLRVGE